MLSEKAEKTKNIYKRMSFFLSLGVAEPGKVSKFMAGFVRYNFNNMAKFFNVAKGAKYKEITLGGVPTWKVTTPNSDPKKILLFFHGGAYMVGSPKAVSYTHLRAHETKANLVCRLLLEKKK